MLNWSIKKTIYLIIILLAIAAAVFFGFFYKATLIVKTTPANAQIELNGLVKTGEATLKLKPGSYQLKVTNSGYIDYEKTISLKIGQSKTVNVDLRLNPEVSKIRAEKISFLVAGVEGKSLFYLSNGGKTLYKADKISAQAPEITAITPEVFSDLTDVVFSPNRLLAVLKKGQHAYLYDFKRYDLLHQEIYDWGEGYGDIIWAPDGEKIVYYYAPAGGEITLIRANRDKTEEERIYNFKDTPIRNPHLAFSADGKKILLSTDKLYLFDLYTKTLLELKEAGKIISAGFTPDSQNIIFESVDGLMAIDLEGKNKTKLEVDTQLNKMAWFDQNSFLYAQSRLGSSDNFYKYDLKTKQKTEYLYTSPDTVAAKDLVLANDGKKVFFDNNGYLYSINLEEKGY